MSSIQQQPEITENANKAGAGQAGLAAASASVARQSHFIPYIIAGAFIVLTALLTLLLTLIIDNKSELNSIITGRQQSTSGPILADARRVFGQEPAPSEPLLDTSLAVSPPDAGKDSTSDDVQGHDNGPLENTFTTELPTAYPQHADLLQLEPPVEMHQSLSGKPIAGAALSAPGKMFEKVVISNHNIGQIIVGHESTISGIQRSIYTNQFDNRAQIQQQIDLQLEQLGQHLRENEEEKWPTYQQSLDARERLIERQYTSFQRMLQHRERVMQRPL